MIIRLLMSLLMIAIVLPTFILGCNKTNIDREESSLVQKVMIPPIDAMEPTETQTATFALG